MNTSRQLPYAHGLCQRNSDQRFSSAKSRWWRLKQVSNHRTTRKCPRQAANLGDSEPQRREIDSISGIGLIYLTGRRELINVPPNVHSCARSILKMFQKISG